MAPKKDVDVNLGNMTALFPPINDFNTTDKP